MTPTLNVLASSGSPEQGGLVGSGFLRQRIASPAFGYFDRVVGGGDTTGAVPSVYRNAQLDIPKLDLGISGGSVIPPSMYHSQPSFRSSSARGVSGPMWDSLGPHSPRLGSVAPSASGQSVRSTQSSRRRAQLGIMLPPKRESSFVSLQQAVDGGVDGAGSNGK
jgi:hypothetical protein